MFLGRQRRMRSAKCLSSFRRPIIAQRRNQAFHSALLRVAPFSLLLVFAACGATLPVTHRPASELRLEIIIGDQFNEKTNVSVSVHVHDETNQREVALADNTRVTCNGTDISADVVHPIFPDKPPHSFWALVSRQPPGGSYKIALHDEHGVSTTATVPVPSGSFTILSPPPGSTVPIPIDDALHCASYCQPHHQVGARAVDDIMLTCGANETTCEELFWTDLQKEATPSAPLHQRHSCPTLAPFLKRTPSHAPTPTATLSQDGDIATITLRADYSQVAPNAARIVVFAHVQAPPIQVASRRRPRFESERLLRHHLGALRLKRLDIATDQRPLDRIFTL